GAVTNLDVVPTLAELCRIDVKDLAFEGKSLVPSLFYGKEDHDRVVFAETNAPTEQRAAISEAWELIFYLHSHLYELYDLIADPRENTNLAPNDPPALAQMRELLEEWRARVVFARDPNFNQMYKKIADVVMTTRPEPPVKTVGQTLDGGRLE